MRHFITRFVPTFISVINVSFLPIMEALLTILRHGNLRSGKFIFLKEKRQVFAIGAAYLIVITQLLDQPPQFAVEPLYAPTQIMYPPCDNDSCKTTNLVIPAALRLFQGCTICVDTLHYLCRMCAERPLLKGIFYS